MQYGFPSFWKNGADIAIGFWHGPAHIKWSSWYEWFIALIIFCKWTEWIDWLTCSHVIDVIPTYANDWLLAVVAFFTILLGVARRTDWLTFTFVECGICDWFLADLACEMFGVPWFTQRVQRLKFVRLTLAIQNATQNLLKIGHCMFWMHHNL